MGVTEISCSFKLVLDGKTGKEIPESSRLEFFQKFSANNFALSDAEDNTSGPLNRGGIADLPLLRTLLAIRQVSRAKFLRSNGLFCFIWMCKFGSFKNPFPIITRLSELKACVCYFLSMFLFFHQLIALKKLWKMFFNSSKKLFLFSRY